MTTAVGAPSCQPPIEFVSWCDPNEGAFTSQVPRDWKVSGGLFRYGATDVRPELTVESEDGQVRAMLGDRTIPRFTEPTRLLAMVGVDEGSWYSPCNGLQFKVMRYVPGPTFAQAYARQKIAVDGMKLRYTDLRDLPELARQIEAIGAASRSRELQYTYRVGETAFTFELEGRPRCGYCLAGTRLTRVPATGGEVNGLWRVTDLYACIAAPERIAEAHTVLQHLVQTFEADRDLCS
jgi:hypothetical protein